MYFHAPCGVVLYSIMCFYIVECNSNFYEHIQKKISAWQVWKKLKTKNQGGGSPHCRFQPV